MSDILVLERPVAKKRAGKVKSVLRVMRGELWVGDILLDRRGRVWRSVNSIPPDVVLKAMVAFNRDGEEQGELVGRRDGLTYIWAVVREPVKGEKSEGAELVEAA